MSWRTVPPERPVELDKQMNYAFLKLPRDLHPRPAAAAGGPKAKEERVGLCCISVELPRV